MIQANPESFQASLVKPHEQVEDSLNQNPTTVSAQCDEIDDTDTISVESPRSEVKMNEDFFSEHLDDLDTEWFQKFGSLIEVGQSGSITTKFSCIEQDMDFDLNVEIPRELLKTEGDHDHDHDPDPDHVGLMTNYPEVKLENDNRNYKKKTENRGH